MANGLPSATQVLVLLLSIIGGIIYTTEIHRGVVVFGVFRKPNSTVITNSQDFKVIPDTTFCEDLHYHAASKLLFTACQSDESSRFKWFPPLGIFEDPTAALKSQGKLEIIDPKTMKAKNLKFTNFNGPFISHGIDVINDPDKPAGKAVYIFAVNHVPSPEFAKDRDTTEAKARSLIEVFRHTIGSDTAEHVRSVWHPLITTPNDIFALSPTSFFVTNDHFYRDGHMRAIEDLYIGATWSTTVHVEFTEATDGSFRNADEGVKASVALEGIHNNNGMGHGRTPKEVLVVSAASGRMHIGELVEGAKDGSKAPTIKISESVSYESTIDNPNYFVDPYATKEHDASGYVNAGLSHAGQLLENSRDPEGKDGVMVWLTSEAKKEAGAAQQKKWDHRLLFEDDASRIRSSSAAVLVAIDPAKEGGKRRAWLYVTGFMSKNVVAVKVDL